MTGFLSFLGDEILLPFQILQDWLNGCPRIACHVQIQSGACRSPNPFDDPCCKSLLSMFIMSIFGDVMHREWKAVW